MQHQIKTAEDLRWLIAHTGGFRSGYVTDVQMSKRRLFDEESGREVPAGTTVSVTIRYQVRELVCVARLLMTSDDSVGRRSHSHRRWVVYPDQHGPRDGVQLGGESRLRAGVASPRH